MMSTQCYDYCSIVLCFCYCGDFVYKSGMAVDYILTPNGQMTRDAGTGTYTDPFSPNRSRKVLLLSSMPFAPVCLRQRGWVDAPEPVPPSAYELLGRCPKPCRFDQLFHRLSRLVSASG